MPFNAVTEVLASFPWLANLGDEIYNILVQGVLLNEPADVIVQNVRNTTAYKTRFEGMAKRQAAGLPAITEAEYLEMESGMKGQLREFNILGTLGLDNETAFRKWAAERIGLDVSVAEINRRLDRGVAIAQDVPDETLQAFQSFYGVQPTQDALLVWALDPQRGVNIIEDQIAAATIGGEALRYGLNITRTRAEILRKEGVTADLAKQGFSDIARESPVLTRLAQIHSLTPLNQTELEEFFFHEDPKIAQRRNQTFSKALAEFQSGSPAQRSRQGGLQEFAERRTF